MVFKRRDKPALPARLRAVVLPRGGWRRAAEYLGHRVKRLPDTPHRIALGFSCGVMASFTPVFGAHFFLAAGLAWLIRGNIVASLLGTLVGNPLTFPLIASVSLGLGRRILGFGATGRDFGRVVEAFGQAFTGVWRSLLSLFGSGQSEWSKLSLFFEEVFWPYAVGGVLPGLAAAIAGYYLVRPVIAAYQKRRRVRMGARIAAHALDRPARPKSEADEPAA